MEYRVEQIARAAGVSVDTVRFYQSRGLLPAPERRGRVAIYSEEHLTRLRRIRELNRRGLTLEAVRRVIEDGEDDAALRRSLMGALREAEGERTYTRAELSASSGVPEMLLEVLDQAGLLEPSPADPEPLYTAADLRTVESARLLLDNRIPLHELLPLAQRHAQHVAEVTDEAIELFDRYVRSEGDDAAPRSLDEVTEAFRELLPAVTALVALHFQRTLIRRAQTRLTGSGDDEALRAAIDATRGRRLELSWSA